MIANNINNNPNKYRLYVIINADFFKKVMQDHSFHVAVLTVVVNVFQGKEILASFTLEIYEDTYFYFLCNNRLNVTINADFFKKVMQDHSFHVAHKFSNQNK